jgi:hypothetical protein
VGHDWAHKESWSRRWFWCSINVMPFQVHRLACIYICICQLYFFWTLPCIHYVAKIIVFLLKHWQLNHVCHLSRLLIPRIFNFETKTNSRIIIRATINTSKISKI